MTDQSSRTAPVRTRVTATLAVRRWDEAMHFYARAFGAVELQRAPGGGVAELSVGGGDGRDGSSGESGATFWVAEESPPHLNFSPESLGGCSVRMLLIVDDPAAMFARALAAGATQVVAVADSHGWRLGRLLDPFGHHWEIGKPLR